MKHKFQKLVLLKHLLDNSSTAKARLFDELIDTATDDNIYMRRFRIISQLNEFESQIIKKIYQFDTANTNDIVDGISLITQELKIIVSRNG